MLNDSNCRECGRPPRDYLRRGLCLACYKRLVWRPTSPAVVRDRQTSRDAKRQRRAAGERI